MPRCFVFIHFRSGVCHWQERDPWRNRSFLADKVISFIVGLAYVSFLLAKVKVSSLNPELV